jgi:Rieske Fe-S protein
MQRRSFLKWATHGLGALFGLVLGIPAVAYLVDALQRKAPEGDFKKVARLEDKKVVRLEDLKVGVPTQVTISDTRVDAWTKHPVQEIGRIWLVRRDEERVDAFTAICPHLGCSINWEGKNFLCPCHGAAFDVQGRLEKGPAPRGMDTLECRVSDGEVEVKYQNFRQNIPAKVART